MSCEGKQLCVANDGARIAILDNACPHRMGPLAEGWLEDGKVICPWHAWAFDLSTGEVDHEPSEKVAVYPYSIEANGDVLITIEGA